MIKDRQIVLEWKTATGTRTYLRSREWLITNGLGGYSSGTLAGIPARKYHGLFVPNLAAPKGRHIMVSRCDEVVLTGTRRLHLGGAEFADERFEGESHSVLREFRLDHRIAIWLFEVDERLFEKSIVMPHNQNTVCVQYRLLRGDAIDVQVRPFVSFRRHDESPAQTPGEAFMLDVRRGRHEIRHTGSSADPAPGRAAGADHVRDRGARRASVHVPHRARSRRSRIRERVQPRLFHRARRARASGRVRRVDARLGAARFRRDVGVRRRTPSARTACSRCRTSCDGDDFAEQLAMAADQFIVLPGSRLEESVLAQAAGGELRSVYAGYHWFGDWGRDTMISLEGLTLSTGRYREAGAILRTFSHYVATACCRTCSRKASAKRCITRWTRRSGTSTRSRATSSTRGDRSIIARAVPGARVHHRASTSRARASTSTSTPPTG